MLSQHGVGEVLIPLRHCWRDAFSVFALAVDRFVTIGRRTAQFCFGPLMRCLFFGLPPFASLDSKHGNFAGRVGVCMSPGVQYHPVKE